MSERRAIRVGKGIISFLVHNQAGSLAKAVLEAVSNSLDAHATRVDITLAHDRIVIADDGIGLRSREEIVKVFEELAFDHDDRQRQLGRFGLGRAQLWAFAKTTWRTSQFEMHVDIRAHGDSYELKDGLDDVPGLRIEGALYEPIDEYKRITTLREIEHLCRYAPIPVYVNGERIGSDPAAMKWTRETDEAYIKVTDGYSLDIYNCGVFVRSVSRSEIGVGGLLVTKLGHPLNLSMSRTEIIETSCPLWKRLKATLRELASEADGRQRMNGATRDYLAARIIGDADAAKALRAPIVTLHPSRHVTVAAFAKLVQTIGMVVVKRPGEAGADVVATNKQAVVLPEATLQRFGVSTAAGLQERLIKAITLCPEAFRNAFEAQSAARCLATGTWHDSLRQSGLEQEPAYRTLTAKDLSDPARALMAALNGRAGESLVWIMRRHCPSSSQMRRTARTLVPGDSGGIAEAWTDGRSSIWLDKSLLQPAMTKGPGGVLRVLSVLVHEYHHDAADAGSHEHDEAFYQSVHDCLIDGAAELWELARTVYLDAYKRIAKPSASHAKGLDRASSAVIEAQAA